MKNKIISGLFIGFTMLTYAQTNNTGISNTPGNKEKKITKQAFGEITIGMAVPTGDFGSSDIYLKEAGFAANGGFLFVNYGIIYNDLYGFEIAVSMGVNPLNKKIDKMLNSIYIPSGIDYDYVKWKNINIIIGPHLSIPIQKFAMDLRLLGGYIYLSRPFIKQAFCNGTLVTEQKNGHGIVWQMGVGIRYIISKNIDIKLSADYFEAKPEIQYQVTEFRSGITGGIYTKYIEKKYTQPISNYNFGIGIIFNFSYKH